MRGVIFFLIVLMPVSAAATMDFLRMDRIERDLTQGEEPLKHAVARRALNPEAVEFRDTTLHQGENARLAVLCGEVNIKGIQAGENWQSFIHGDKTYLEEDEGFTKAWERHCE